VGRRYIQKGIANSARDGGDSRSAAHSSHTHYTTLSTTQHTSRRLVPSALTHLLYPRLCSQSLKGVAGDVIILEEAVRQHTRRPCPYVVADVPSLVFTQAYCDPGLISEVYVCLYTRVHNIVTNMYSCVLLCTRSVVPLLSMSNSVLLCISTLLDGGNHYSSCHARCLAFYPPHCQGGACLLPNLLSVLVCAGKMFDLTDSVGRKLFESIAITLVCADCLKTEHRKRHALLLCYLHVLTPLLCSQPKSARTSWQSTFLCIELMPGTSLHSP